MNHNKKRQKRLGIDKKSAIIDNSSLTQFDIDLVGDEVDNELWIFQANLNSPEVKQSIGTDILQELKRTVSGSEK